MPFPHHVFRHTPALRGLITPPDESELRFGLDRFAELDIQAEKEGWPPGWRMEHDAREANRLGVLEGRMVQDLWVFAYGSLIWDPAVQVEEYRYGTLPGWRRSFCMRLEGGRGSFARPGLMATRFTMEETFYRARLEAAGLAPVVPDAADRAETHRIIYDELCRDELRGESRAAYEAIAARLGEAGADCLILGCTEIGMLLGEANSPLPVFDTTRIHCEAALEAALG